MKIFREIGISFNVSKISEVVNKMFSLIPIERGGKEIFCIPVSIVFSVPEPGIESGLNYKQYLLDLSSLLSSL
jgi:hypothetical protein